MIKRNKKEWLIVTFHTTAAAFQIESTAKNIGLKGRLIPVPREISAGCGLAWRDEKDKQDEIKKCLENIEYEKLFLLTL